MPEPQFEGQTKTKLGNGEIEGIVNTVGRRLPGQVSGRESEGRQSHRAKGHAGGRSPRERPARRRRCSASARAPWPAAACPASCAIAPAATSARCELYLVEGDSAGGSAEGGRLREYQAILPLRGKIINAYKSREDKVLANEEVRSMISAIGAGIGEEVDLAKRRYSKIVIMTDADVDGSHIRTLLLDVLLSADVRAGEQGGYVYVAQPPLFRVKSKKDAYYVQTEEEMKAQLLESGPQRRAVFEPGDGRTIEGAAMARLCRTLAAMEDSLIALERRGISLRTHALRQDPVSGKLPIYHVFLGTQEHWFTHARGARRLRRPAGRRDRARN